MQPNSFIIPPFAAFTKFSPLLPQFYYDVPSIEQRVKELCKTLAKIAAYSDELATQLNIDTEALEKLEADFKTFMESGFDDYYKAQVAQYIADNIDSITQQFTQKSVYFGLTSDGYFCAYIPENWSDIVFDTGTVYGRSDYGRLILRFSSDGSGVIDNTYGYSLAQPTEVETLIRDLEVVTNRSDETYDAVFTNMNEVITHVV